MDLDVENLFNRRADRRWERTSVGDVFERLCWSTPDKPALVASPCATRDPAFARVSYREADRAANRIAHALLQAGLQRGDRVALFCDNSVEAFLAKIGIAKAGLVAQPINTLMAPDMVTHSLRHAGTRVAIVDAESLPRASAALEAAGTRVLAVLPDASGESAGHASLQSLMQAQPDSEPDVRIHGDDIWEILMTSGTTAMPKAVMISHHYSYMAGMNQALAYSRGLRFESDFRMCTFLPLIYHIGDQIFGFSALLSGGTLVIGRLPTPQNQCATIAAERPTALFGGSPQFLSELAREAESGDPAPDLSSLQVIVFGWAALPPELASRLDRLCKGVMPIGIFGQTECIALHRFPIDRFPEVYRETAPATNVVGLPTPLLASNVVDEQGRSMHGQAGKSGEAVYRSPAITAGYFRDQQATREAFRDGWFHSGDMCQVRADGLRVMVDRYKDVVKSGGENVSSLRVEAVAATFPGVARVAVVGLPDPRWGEAVTAVVVPNEGAEIDAEALIAHCRAHLAGFETPKRVVRVDALPVTVGGKVLKYKLRQQLAEVPG